MPKVTIDTISRETGLSRGTISRAINDRSDISAETKQRVLDACQKLNYSPSQAARSLATGRNLSVVVVLEDLAAAYAGPLLRSALQRAEQGGYSLQIVELGRDREIAANRLRRLPSQRGDGWLFVAKLTDELATVCRELPNPRPIVLAQGEGLAGDHFELDEAEAGRLVVGALQRCGPHVHYVLREHNRSDAVRAGVVRACAEVGLDPSQLLLEVPRGGCAAEVMGLERLARCTGLAASDDATAAMLLAAVRALGREVGRDVAIIGRGNERLCELTCPALTSIDLGEEEIGRRAMDTLLARIAGDKSDAPQHTLVAPRLIARASARV